MGREAKKWKALFIPIRTSGLGENEMMVTGAMGVIEQWQIRL